MNEELDNVINPDVQPPEKPDLKKDLAHWRKLLAYMGANVPIQVLCLPKAVEKSLISEGILRVYDLIDRDLAEIKGIGVTRAELIASRLDEFFTVSI